MEWIKMLLAIRAQLSEPTRTTTHRTQNILMEIDKQIENFLHSNNPQSAKVPCPTDNIPF